MRLTGDHYSVSAELRTDTTFCKVPTGEVVSASSVRFHQRRTFIEETSFTAKVNRKNGVMSASGLTHDPAETRNETPAHQQTTIEELRGTHR